MENSEDLTYHLTQLKRGLDLLSRERKVVLPHNKAFDLVDDLKVNLENINNILDKKS